MSCRLLRGASEKNLSFKSEVNFPSQAYICMYRHQMKPRYVLSNQSFFNHDKAPSFISKISKLK